MTPILGQLQTIPPVKPEIGERIRSSLMGLKMPSPTDAPIATHLKILSNQMARRLF
jgi:hypothetical protein